MIFSVSLGSESIVEVDERQLFRASYLDPTVIAPIVSGIACTLALLACVAIAVSRG